MFSQSGRIAAPVLFLCALAGCERAPSTPGKPASAHSAVSPGKSASAHSAVGAGRPQATPRASAAELYRQADVELASVRSDDVQELVSFLDDPNPYLRASALKLLTPHAARLSADAVRRVVDRLVDPERIMARECVGYESSKRAVMGQGMMFLAAECAANHPVTISGLAAAVLAQAPAPALASAGVLASSERKELIGELEPVVRARETELTLPLEGELVRAESANRGAEVDAALALLANGTIGAGRPETLDALARTSEAPNGARALSALCVFLTLSYRGAGAAMSERAVAGYARLRDAIRARRAVGSSSAAPSDVFANVRRMRAAAAPLLPELVSVLSVEDEHLRGLALWTMTSMGVEARPAIPSVRRLLVQGAPPDDVDGFSLIPALELIGAARPPAAGVAPAILTAVRRYPTLFDEAVAALVSMKARLGPSDRAVLRRVYGQHCADAGSIANFSFSRDERCFLASEKLKQLGVLRRESQ